jgi:ACS family glucarate transporter-like MFS transporter
VKPGRVRFGVVGFAVSLGMLSYIQRVAISQAARPMSVDLHLDKQQMGAVLGAFGLAYALCEIPMGLYGDSKGPRRVLTQIVLAWSLFTALTGAVWSFTSLWVVRFLFGAGEAGCFPNLNRMLSQWLPRDERVRMQALMWASTRWGGAITPPLAMLGIALCGWRWSFLAFALLGVVWCVTFLHGYRDDPATHPRVNAAELALIHEAHEFVSGGDTTVLQVLRRPQVILLAVQYSCWAYIWYFFVTWMPTYIIEALGQSPAAAAGYAMMPLLCGGFGALASGLLPLWMPRRAIAMGAYLVVLALLLVLPHVHAAAPAIAILAAISFAGDFTVPISWNASIEFGRRYTATVSATMNMCANFAGFIAPVIGGALLAHHHDGWALMMQVMAGFALLGAISWIFLDPASDSAGQRDVGQGRGVRPQEQLSP